MSWPALSVLKAMCAMSSMYYTVSSSANTRRTLARKKWLWSKHSRLGIKEDTNVDMEKLAYSKRIRFLGICDRFTNHLTE